MGPRAGLDGCGENPSPRGGGGGEFDPSPTSEPSSPYSCTEYTAPILRVPVIMRIQVGAWRILRHSPTYAILKNVKEINSGNVLNAGQIFACGNERKVEEQYCWAITVAAGWGRVATDEVPLCCSLGFSWTVLFMRHTTRICSSGLLRFFRDVTEP